MLAATHKCRRVICIQSLQDRRLCTLAKLQHLSHRLSTTVSDDRAHMKLRGHPISSATGSTREMGRVRPEGHFAGVLHCDDCKKASEALLDIADCRPPCLQAGTVPGDTLQHLPHREPLMSTPAIQRLTRCRQCHHPSMHAGHATSAEVCAAGILGGSVHESRAGRIASRGS